MSKQEEIREWIQKYLEDILSAAWRKGVHGKGIDVTEEANEARLHLTKWGVVLKVDRELPNNPYKRKPRIEGYDLSYDPNLDMAGYYTQQAMLKAGYVAVVPLIEETQKEVTNESSKKSSRHQRSESDKRIGRSRGTKY